MPTFEEFVTKVQDSTIQSVVRTQDAYLDLISAARERMQQTVPADTVAAVPGWVWRAPAESAKATLTFLQKLALLQLDFAVRLPAALGIAEEVEAAA